MKLKIILSSLLFILFSPYVILEEQANIPLQIPVFIIKFALQFLALIPFLWGLGDLLLGLFARFSSEKKSLPLDSFEKIFEIFLRCLLGILCTGWLVFFSGKLFNGGKWLILPPIFLGSFAFLKSFSKEIVPTNLKKECCGSSGKILFLWMFFYMLRASCTFFFQSHGDAYLYHFAVTEVWERTGNLGVFVSNIYSGYSMCVENYFLFLKLAFVGHAEQNALAQMSAVVFAFFPWLLSLLLLARPHLSRLLCLALSFVLLQPEFFYYFTLPKNDPFLISVVVVALSSLLRKRPREFLACATVAFSIKATAAIAFLGMGITTLLFSQSERRKKFILLLTAACAMLLFWSPFAIFNYIATKNPLFPLANEIFKSPYGPQSLSDVVLEMRPFSLTPMGFWLSIKHFFQIFPWIFAGFVGFLFCLFRKICFNGTKVESALFFYTLFTCSLLFLFMGEFNDTIAGRHFYVISGPAIVLAFFVFAKCNSNLFVNLILLFAIFSTNIETAFFFLERRFKIGGITKSIFENKPELYLNHFLTQKFRNKELPFSDLLYLSSPVFGAFYEEGEVWSKGISYPMWGWKLAEVSTDKWKQFLSEKKIKYAILSSENPYPEFEKLSMEVLAERDSLRLISIKEAF